MPTSEQSEDQQRLCCRVGKAREDGEMRMWIESGMARAKGLGREIQWRDVVKPHNSDGTRTPRLRLKPGQNPDWDLNPVSFN